MTKSKKTQKQKSKGKKANRPVRKAPSLTNNADVRPIVRRPSPPKVNHIRGACSVTDPFCPAAKNSKWPDGTSGNTMTEQFRGNLSLSSDADGSGLVVFVAAAPYGYIGTTDTSATVKTTVATFQPYQVSSMLATYGAQYRVVSFGCIIRCTASATTASGLLTIGTGEVPRVSTAYTIGQEYYDEVVVKAIQPGMEIAWVSQPRGPGARSFEYINGSGTPPLVSDWTNLWLELSGCQASTALLNIEWYMNLEFTVSTVNRAITTLARPNPPKVGSAETITSKVHNGIGSFIEGGVKEVEDRVFKAASNALSSMMSDPIESLASLFAM